MFPTTCPVCKKKSLAHDDETIFCTNCHAYNKRVGFIRRHFAWAEKQRGWWWRGIILVVFAIWLVENWAHPGFAMDRLGNPISAIDFGVHELGHALFSPFGEFMHILGGSLFQVIFPIIAIVGFYQIKYYFAAVMSWCWVGMSLFDVAAYAADAQVRLLPLATGFAGLGEQNNNETYDRAHDWFQILSRTGLLGQTDAIAAGIRVAASVVFIVGLLLGAILIFLIIKNVVTSFDNSSTQ